MTYNVTQITDPLGCMAIVCVHVIITCILDWQGTTIYHIYYCQMKTLQIISGLEITELLSIQKCIILFKYLSHSEKPSSYT